LLDQVADWLTAEAQRTRTRWGERMPEAAVLGALSTFVALLALAEGASFALVAVLWLAVAVTIWAPWRRVEVEHDVAEEREPQAISRGRGELAS
jgi:hypothetical protein